MIKSKFLLSFTVTSHCLMKISPFFTSYNITKSSVLPIRYSLNSALSDLVLWNVSYLNFTNHIENDINITFTNASLPTNIVEYLNSILLMAVTPANDSLVLLGMLLIKEIKDGWYSIILCFLLMEILAIKLVLHLLS